MSETNKREASPGSMNDRVHYNTASERRTRPARIDTAGEITQDLGEIVETLSGQAERAEPPPRKAGGERTHAWKGTWNRPVKVDEDSLDPLTLARMTDHNVRGRDEPERDYELSDEEAA